MAQVQLFRTAGSPPCGGAVIAHPWLITFGTCVGDRTMQIVVHVGDTQRTTTGGIRVNRVVRPPQAAVVGADRVSVALDNGAVGAVNRGAQRVDGGKWASQRATRPGHVPCRARQSRGLQLKCSRNCGRAQGVDIRPLLALHDLVEHREPH